MPQLVITGQRSDLYSLLPPVMIDAQIHSYSEQPSVETSVSTKLFQPFHSPVKGFLSQLHSVIIVAHHPKNRVEQTILILQYQLFEGSHIACPASFYKHIVFAATIADVLTGSICLTFGVPAGSIGIRVFRVFHTKHLIGLLTLALLPLFFHIYLQMSSADWHAQLWIIGLFAHVKAPDDPATII